MSSIPSGSGGRAQAARFPEEVLTFNSMHPGARWLAPANIYIVMRYKYAAPRQRIDNVSQHDGLPGRGPITVHNSGRSKLFASHLAG
jgi:hypothetical protein